MEDEVATKKAPATPTGYATADTFFATMFRQGGRTVYSLDLSPNQLMALLVRPDPDRPVESNREIRKKHAEGFADYFIEHDQWVIPGMILRSPQKFKFEVQEEVSGTKFGLLEVPRSSAREISILDGQHRTLGFFMAADKLAERIEAKRDLLQKTERQSPGGPEVAFVKRELEALRQQASRLESERLSVLVYVESDMKAYRQMFFDISDNALGITASVRARFDSRKVVNRALPIVLEHPLLRGRVEMDADRLKQNDPSLLTAKNVTEIIRNVLSGITGRIGKKREQVLQENKVAEAAKAFLDLLVRSFAPLQLVQLDQLKPQELRQRSLTGSPAFLRLLAGLYHDLTDTGEGGRAWPIEKVEAFFARLAPHVSSTDGGNPVYQGSIWLDRMPSGSFVEGQITPSTMRQLYLPTYETLLKWAVVPQEADFLDAPPAPRPAPITDEDILKYEEERAAKREASDKK